MHFYREHHDDLERENPHLTPQELTKLAMSKYKQLFLDKSNGSGIESNGIATADESNNGQTEKQNPKRKINQDEGTERSGMAKLARFSFKNQ